MSRDSHGSAGVTATYRDLPHVPDPDLAGDADWPTVAVALCTYQGAAFLAEQLDSILAQTSLPQEIVISDDGSTDETGAIIEKYRCQAPELIRVLARPSAREAPEAGPVAGDAAGASQVATSQRIARHFFACAKACRADIILFCDQDDFWLPNRIDLFRRAFSATKHAADVWLLQSDGQIVDRFLRPTGDSLWRATYLSRAEQRLIQHGLASHVLARHPFVTGAALAVRRDFFNRVPWPGSDFLHDEWLGWFAGKHIRLLHEQTFLYRQHQQQMTGADRRWLAQWRRLQAPDARTARPLRQAAERYRDLARTLRQTALLTQDWCHAGPDPDAFPHDEEALDRKHRYQQNDAPDLEALANLAQAKADWLILRSQVKTSWWPRLSFVISHWLDRSYQRLGQGWRTALKDLLGRDRA